MIAARSVGSYVRDELVTRAQISQSSFYNSCFPIVSALGIVGRPHANGFQKVRAHICDKTRERPRRRREVKDGFVFEKISADHIHVNIRTQTAANLRMTAQISHGAFNFGSPHESQGAPGPWQCAGLDEVSQD